MSTDTGFGRMAFPRLHDEEQDRAAEQSRVEGHAAGYTEGLRLAAEDVARRADEINAEHALVKKLDSSTHFDDLANVLFDQAVLAEGGHLEDPAAYVRRVNAMLLA